MVRQGTMLVTTVGPGNILAIDESELAPGSRGETDRAVRRSGNLAHSGMHSRTTVQ
jgi:hypothetical protein